MLVFGGVHHLVAIILLHHVVYLCIYLVYIYIGLPCTFAMENIENCFHHTRACSLGHILSRVTLSESLISIAGNEQWVAELSVKHPGAP